MTSYIILSVTILCAIIYYIRKWRKSKTITKVQIQGYAGLPPLIWCYNAKGEQIDIVKCEGWQVLKLGGMTITIKNSVITKIL